MTVINTNTAAINAQYNLSKVQSAMDDAMSALSSGKRITSAADDAAGLNIITRMESQVRGLNQAMRNAADGQSMVDTAEGAMEEMTNMLQRMRELALQAGNSVMNPQDRAALDSEFQQLTAEIDRIVRDTTFNDQVLLDGSMSGNLQVGTKAGEKISYQISNMSASSLGRDNLTLGALANVEGSATGTAATTTVARLSFSGPDTYTFRVADVSVSGSLATATMTTDLRNLATTINDNLKAAGNTDIVAEAKNGAIELKNITGNNIALTNFSSAGQGTAQFDIITGGGSSAYLDDTAAVQTSNIAQGTAASSSGVRLTTDATGNYTFKVNGVSVVVDAADTDSAVKTKLANALGTGYEVYIKTDTGTESAAWDAATTSYDVAGLAAGEYAIFNSANGKAVNITEFKNLDARAAGTLGTVRVADGSNEAVMVDSTNQFTVANGVGTANPVSIDLAFSSATSDYEVRIDSAVYLIRGDDLADGTAASKLIAEMNLALADATGVGSLATTAAAAAGLGSLGNTQTAGATGNAAATEIGLEVVQNGMNISIKKKAAAGDLIVGINGLDAAGLTAASIVDVTGGTVGGGAKVSSANNGAAGWTVGTGIDAFDAVAAKTGSFSINDTAGASIASSAVNLVEQGTAIYSTGTATKTAATLTFSGNGTFTFKVGDSVGNTSALTTSVVGGSAQQVVADLNNLLSGSAANLQNITARLDPNNSQAIILERNDGKQIKIVDFSSVGNETALFSPSAGQGNVTTLNDNTYPTSGTATAAGLADATQASMKFSGEDYTEFKISDGVSTAVVRRTATDSANNGALLKAEIDRALAAAGISSITTGATAANNSTTITFNRADGGLIDIQGFKTDGSNTATFTPTSGQGIAKVLDDNAGQAGSGKSVSDLDLNTVVGASEATSIIDNALQQINNMRSDLGAISNRLDHTINNLGNIVVNTEAAQSRIEDADFASETSNLTKAQILSQAATAMLAQANASKQSVLSLLQG